mgnify:CR=1 FL=1
MTRVISLTNRLNRIERFGNFNKKKNSPHFIIDNGHIHISDNNFCILCGNKNYQNKCEKILTDEELQDFMVNETEDFLLFISLHPFKFTDADNDDNAVGKEYSNFIEYPELSDNSVMVKFYDRKLISE